MCISIRLAYCPMHAFGLNTATCISKPVREVNPVQRTKVKRFEPRPTKHSKTNSQAKCLVITIPVYQLASKPP